MVSRLLTLGVSTMIAGLMVVVIAAGSYAETTPMGTKVPAGTDPAKVAIKSTPVGKEEGGVTATATDLEDRVLGKYTLREFSGAPDQETGDVRLAPSAKDSGVSALSASRSGCRWVDVWRTKYTALGYVFIKFHQRKNWCYKSGRITFYKVQTYVSDVADTAWYRGVVGSYGGYYGNRYGHYSYREGHVENCVTRLGCFKSLYPWVKITVRANGTYSRSWGG